MTPFRQTRSARFAGLLFAVALLLPPFSSAAQEKISIAVLAETLAERYQGRRPKLWGERLPGVTTSLPEGIAQAHDGSRRIALTLDACGGGADMRIIAVLRDHAVPAAIFATNIWLRRNAALAKELAVDPLFTFACHGARHKPASVDGRKAFGVVGTKSVADLVGEVETNARAVAALTGKRPKWHRSGTAHYDDVAVEVVNALGLGVAGYTVSDEGASLSSAELARRLIAAPDRAIVLCHVNRPESETAEGLARAIPVMLKKGARFVTLE